MLDSDQMNNRTSDSTSESSDNDLLLAMESGTDGHSLRTNVERNVDIACIIHKHYHEDTVFVKVLECPTAHLCFGIRDKLIWTKNQMGRDVVCILWKAFLRGRRLVKIIINQAHTMIGHFGQFHTSRYIRRYYWWPSMGTDIEWYCSSCSLWDHVKSQRTLIRSPADCYTPY